MDEASETLGVRTAADGDPELNPESPFGAAGSGCVTAPCLPGLADDGGKLNAGARTVPGGGAFAVGPASTAVADDDNPITLSSTVLGLLTEPP